MTDRSEAERLLSTAYDEIIEIDDHGNIYPKGQAPALPGKRIPGITDVTGEYAGDPSRLTRGSIDALSRP